MCGVRPASSKRRVSRNTCFDCQQFHAPPARGASRESMTAAAKVPAIRGGPWRLRMPVSISAPKRIIAPPKRARVGSLRQSNDTARPPSNPHIATDEPAPTGFQTLPASSPTTAPVRYKISHRALPNMRSTRKPTIAMPGRLKTICDQPSGLINIGVIRRHHWPEASILGVRSSATIRTGKQNCSPVTIPVTKRTVSIALGVFCTMPWDARSRNPLH